MRCTTDTLPPQGLLQCHITIRLPDDFINSIILIKMHPVVGGKKKKSHPAEFPSDSRVKKNLGESAGENNVEEQVCFHAGVYAGTSGAQG